MKKNKSIKYKKQKGGAISQAVKNISTNSQAGKIISNNYQAGNNIPVAEAVKHIPFAKAVFNNPLVAEAFSNKNSKDVEGNKGEVKKEIEELLPFFKKTKKQFVNAVWWRNLASIVTAIFGYIGYFISLIFAALPAIVIIAIVIIILEIIIIALNLAIFGFYKKVLKPITKIIPIKMKKPKPIPHSWIILWKVFVFIVTIMIPPLGKWLKELKMPKFEVVNVNTEKTIKNA
jgi:hypothetical protein